MTNNIWFTRTRVLLLVFSLIIVSASSNRLSAQYVHALGTTIVDGQGHPLLLRGIGLGGWLVPEGYMLGVNSPGDSPTGFRNKVLDVLGNDTLKTDAFFAAYRHNYVQRKDVDSIAAWGFNSIRLPFHYGILSPARGAYREAGFAIVDSLLAWCEANNLYLILDMHCAPGGQNTGNISDYQGYPSLWENAVYQTWTAEIWKEIARRYADKRWIAGYDLLNETSFDFSKIGASGNQPLYTLMRRITDSIRTVDRHHMVFIEGNWWATDFAGLEPRWDINMAWSFHKYWSGNEAGSIAQYLNLRSTSQCPLWMGESGENSNQWFADAIALFEQSGIGWSWWTLKKIESISCPLSVRRSPSYDTVRHYWNDGGTKPSVAYAEAALAEQAALLDADSCVHRPDFLDALFRLPVSTDRRPYASNILPGVIHATDYDMGRNGVAYADVDYENLGVGYYNQGWSYRNDGVDIEPCSDPGSNGYDVGWAAAGEFLTYTVTVQATGSYNVTIRSASNNSGGSLRLLCDGVDLVGTVSLPGTGGWQSWMTSDLGTVQLSSGVHTLQLKEVTGGYNIGRIEFSLLTAVPEKQGMMPVHSKLGQNWPNPWNPSTTIAYTIGEGERGGAGDGGSGAMVRLSVYDLLGREVALLVNESQRPGVYEVTLNAAELSTGVYFYRLQAGKFTDVKKMIVVK